MSTPLRVGLVGAGPWAGMATAPLLAAGPATTLTAVWARRPDAAAGLAGRHGAVAAGSFEELLERCDAVAFAVPPDVQADLAVGAARAGRHLLLEKPLATTGAAAEALAGAVDAAGVVSQLCLTNRWSTAVRTLLEEVAGTTVDAATTQFVSGAALPGSPFATPWRTADSALLDVGPHALDLLVALAGPVERVSAAIGPAGAVLVTTRHAGGVAGSVLLSTTTPGARGPLRAEVLTDAGRLVLTDPSAERPDVVGGRMVADFAAAVAAGVPPALDVHSGVRLQRLLAAVAQSLSEGTAVPVPTSQETR
ncbi:Predicted dehydrogenase [Geodermatophilus amargosae]|uniref:Predicted dehydrogenase n=1 Tax=Geodermatophilus amargosae TaxID=1296565 RepID=A0A1I7BBA3_9ACTN|nr:Gfo/Idh/MocA family oxidoreductase [Geodermatophilus amargosae]SFT84479.1 Predicted dehydrogenase [Geodermatophilus amargosae]